MSAEIDRLRLAKLLGLLGSDHDSEVAAAGRAADRLRRAAGATWHDIVQPALPPPNRDYSIAEQIEIARGCPNELTDWERQFVASLALRRKPLTEKQRAVLAEIVVKCRAAARCAT